MGEFNADYRYNKDPDQWYRDQWHGMIRDAAEPDPPCLSADLTMLLSSSFMKLVLLATVLAWPIAWLTLDSWLEAFAYRIPLDAAPFLIAGALAFLIVTVTVSYQAIKTSRMNPVESLRNE